MKLKTILVFALAAISIFLIWPTYESDVDRGCHDLIDPEFSINSDCDVPPKLASAGGGLRYTVALFEGKPVYSGANSFELFWINEVEYFTPRTALVYSFLGGIAAAAAFYALKRFHKPKSKA